MSDYQPKHRKEYAMDENGNKLPGAHEADNLADYPEELPSSKTQPKVVAAATGAGIGAALATVVIWGIEAPTGFDIPDVVEGAITVLVSAAVSWASGYIKKG